MAQTPIPGAAGINVDAERLYLDGWRSLNAAIRRGEPWSGDERNAAFVSVVDEGGALGFVDAAPLLGLDDPGDGRAAARIDLDFDGDDDLVLTQRTAPRVRLLRGRLADGAVGLEVLLEGTTSNREGIGATVYATPLEGTIDEARERVHARTRSAGSGYLAQSTAWLRFHFGPPGESRRAPRVQLHVRWPGRSMDELEDFGVVRTGGAYLLREGNGTPVERPRPAAVELAEAPIPAADPGAPLRVRLPVFASTASLTVRDGAGRVRPAFGLTPSGPRGLGLPTVAVVLDSTSPGAVEALGDLRGLSAACAARELPHLAIDLAAPAGDSGPDPLPFAASALGAAGWAGPVVAAEGEARSVLEEFYAWRIGADEPPPLPWTILFDPDGRVASLRTGPWTAGELEGELVTLAAPPEARPALAAPHGGRWLDPPGPVDLAPLQARLEARGAARAARELGLARVVTSELDPGAIALELGVTQLRTGQLEEAVATFSKAVEIAPEEPRAHQGLALALQSLGSSEEAFAAWGRSLELAPDDRTSLVNHALLAVSLGELDSARRDLAGLEAQGERAAAAVAAVREALAEAARDDGGR